MLKHFQSLLDRLFYTSRMQRSLVLFFRCVPPSFFVLFLTITCAPVERFHWSRTPEELITTSQGTVMLYILL